MKILVTGGTVFVSKFVAEYFRAKRNEVYVLNRNTKPQLPGVRLIECDRKKINGRLKGLRFDAVIDVNAYTACDIHALLDGLESFDNYVFISSSAVYPETLAIPFKENDSRGKNKFWGDYGAKRNPARTAAAGHRLASRLWLVQKSQRRSENEEFFRLHRAEIKIVVLNTDCRGRSGDLY